MTFVNYNNWCLNQGLNPYAFNYNMNSCFCAPQNDYFSGQIVGSLFAIAGYKITSSLISGSSQKKANAEAANNAINKTITDNLAKMPEGYNTEATYNKADIFDNIAEAKTLTTAKSTTKEAEGKVTEAKQNKETAQNNFNSKESAFKTAETSFNSAKETLSKTPTTDKKYKEVNAEFDRQQKLYNTAKTEYEKAEKKLNEAKEAEKTANSNLEEAQKKEKAAQTAFDEKKTAIEGIKKTITEAIKKREDAKAYAAFDKGDGNGVQRHLFNSQFKTTDKAKTRASIKEFSEALRAYQSDKSQENKNKLKSAYTTLKTNYKNYTNSGKSNSDIETALSFADKYAKQYGLEQS